MWVDLKTHPLPLLFLLEQHAEIFLSSMAHVARTTSIIHKDSASNTTISAFPQRVSQPTRVVIIYNLQSKEKH